MKNRREFLKKSAVLAGAGTIFSFPMTVNGDDDICENLGRFRVEDVIEKAYCVISMILYKEEMLSRKEKRKPRQSQIILKVKTVTVTVNNNITLKYTVHYHFYVPTERTEIKGYQISAPNGKKGGWRTLNDIDINSSNTLKMISDTYV